MSISVPLRLLPFASHLPLSSGATQAPIITLAAAASALAMIDFANMEVD